MRHVFMNSVTRLSLFALPFSIALSSAASGAIIGVNFTGGTFGGSPPVSLGSTEFAGVIPSANYNNVASANTGAPISLFDDSGTATTMTLTITGAVGPYSTISGAGINPQGGDEKLNTGFLAGNSTLTLTGIPYASYNIYVYALNDNESRVQATTVNGLTFYHDSPNAASRVDQNLATDYVYTLVTSTNPAAQTVNANYVLFTGLSGQSQTISVNATGNGFINGFQVVQVPEPGTAFFALSSGLLVLGLSRRREAA
jgi:hypothetical protein